MNHSHRHPATVALSLGAALLLGGTLLTGCVVKYGTGEGTTPALRPAEPAAPPADFAEVQDRFEALYTADVDVDRRDRLDAAMDLLRRGRTMEPQAQATVLAYLKRVLAIEERAAPMEAPALFETPAPGEVASFTPLGTPIEEEDLGGVEQIEPVPGAAPDAPGPEAGSSDAAAPEADAPEAGAPAAGAPEAPSPAHETAGEDPAPEADVHAGDADPVSMARSALAAGDPPGALSALEPCARVDCGPDAAALAVEARDAWVHAERERAGALFLRARGEPDPVERAARLVEARDILVALLERFPDAAQADDVRRNIDLVQAELDAVR